MIVFKEEKTVYERGPVPSLSNTRSFDEFVNLLARLTSKTYKEVISFLNASSYITNGDSEIELPDSNEHIADLFSNKKGVMTHAITGVAHLEVFNDKVLSSLDVSVFMTPFIRQYMSLRSHDIVDNLVLYRRSDNIVITDTKEARINFAFENVSSMCDVMVPDMTRLFSKIHENSEIELYEAMYLPVMRSTLIVPNAFGYESYYEVYKNHYEDIYERIYKRWFLEMTESMKAKWLLFSNLIGVCATSSNISDGPDTLIEVMGYIPIAIYSMVSDEIYNIQFGTMHNAHHKYHTIMIEDYSVNGVPFDIDREESSVLRFIGNVVSSYNKQYLPRKIFQSNDISTLDSGHISYGSYIHTGYLFYNSDAPFTLDAIRELVLPETIRPILIGYSRYSHKTNDKFAILILNEEIADEDIYGFIEVDIENITGTYSTIHKYAMDSIMSESLDAVTEILEAASIHVVDTSTLKFEYVYNDHRIMRFIITDSSIQNTAIWNIAEIPDDKEVNNNGNI